ncbi:hypothetical protein IEN91_05130 [Bacillus velezensis]|uniref:hypothetical protein n=1 Tax=Bacillus velezensis TaxID=492670 RepID=UPI0018C83576|nr:hypothetical protein [Bacillus velezensis]QPK89822.1 hypothetical protein IEN91_05130 [Bacillus velezensis]
MEIKINIESCDKCPHATVSKVYTADSFEDVRKIYCKLLKKDVYEYLEWRDKSPIPEKCPAKV